MIRTTPALQGMIIGAFLFLAAVVVAVAPLAIAYRSLGIVLFSYLAFGMGGMPFAYLTALLAPPLGLITGNVDWLVMLPIILSSNLLAMLGLEFSWRYPALIISPLLLIIPQIFVLMASKRSLFQVKLPWEPNAAIWVALHALVALAGILAVIYLDRHRASES